MNCEPDTDRGLRRSGFWAVDDAFAVWLAYLVEVLNNKEPRGAQVHDWRVACGVPSYGMEIGSLTERQRRRLTDAAAAARDRARDEGTSPSIDSGHGISSDLPVSGGFSRTGALLMDDIDPGVD